MRKKTRRSRPEVKCRTPSIIRNDDELFRSMITQTKDKYHRVQCGKGSCQRPCDKEAFDQNYDDIFRKKDTV